MADVRPQGRAGGPASPHAPLRVAIVGAESTGKSELARNLAARLEADFGLRAVVVGEFLREWCDRESRTPRVDEQAAIAAEQQRRIDAAAAGGVEVVLCDTTPLMITVYSELVFGDRSLDALAAAAQRTADHTLLTALDLPWVADGLQRDGPHVREPVDRLVRDRLVAWGGRWSVVSGVGAARVDCALDALRPVLKRWAHDARARHGLFSSLLDGTLGPRPPAGLAYHGLCELCDRGDLEHLSRPSKNLRD